MLCGNKEDPNASATDSSPEDSEDDPMIELGCATYSIPINEICATYSIPRREPRVYGGLMTIKCNEAIDNNHWSKTKGSNNMEYMKFKKVVDLDVSGSIPMRKLYPNRAYKGVFEVKLANDIDASGWDGNHVTIEVSGPGGISLSSTHNVLKEKSLTTATFTTPNILTGDLIFRLHQKSEDVKEGLIIKRFIVRRN